MRMASHRISKMTTPIQHLNHRNQCGDSSKLVERLQNTNWSEDLLLWVCGCYACLTDPAGLSLEIGMRSRRSPVG
jgi:hypothetical protein